MGTRYRVDKQVCMHCFFYLERLIASIVSVLHCIFIVIRMNIICQPVYHIYHTIQ